MKKIKDKIGIIDGIAIYYSKQLGNDEVIIGRKNKKLNSKIVQIPSKSYSEFFKECLKCDDDFDMFYDKIKKEYEIDYANITFLVVGSNDLDKCYNILNKWKRK